MLRYYHERNTPLLCKRTRVYGACAIIARINDRIVGMLRFYPKAVCTINEVGSLCFQQNYPTGQADDFADSFEDLPIIYEITGSAGHTFREKLGFTIVDRYPHPEMQKYREVFIALEKKARSIGISPEKAWDTIIMALEWNKN